MKQGKDLIDKVARGLEASPTTSPTQAGQTKKQLPGEAHIDAINQVFALFRLNYHNQYYAAFSDTQQLNQIKKLWAESLAGFSPEQILLAAKRAIEELDYLPTLNRMLTLCKPRAEDIGLPDAHAAYREACQAPSPKSDFNWSHPAVYHAGRESDWFFLAGTPEAKAFPVFKRHYDILCDRVMNGEELEAPLPLALPDKATEALSKDEQLAQLKKLRQETGL
jgi:hypothetical protein